MEAKARFETEEVVNYTHTFDGKIVPNGRATLHSVLQKGVATCSSCVMHLLTK